MKFSINGWRLFWTLVSALSIATVTRCVFIDFSSAKGVEPVIVFCVRCALPLFIGAFTASSIRVLWPNPCARWLLRNRRFVGLAFAVGMAWHLTFVAYSFARFGNNLNRTVLTLDVAGAAFLVLLTATSFRSVSRLISAVQWRRLHKAGVYAIWLLATYIYAEGFRGDRDIPHFAALLALVCALALRVAAWLRARAHPRLGSESL